MQEFSKIFKNLVVILDNDQPREVFKVGYSVKLENGILQLYREEGRLGEGKSWSRGKRKTIRFKGRPTIEGVYGLISVELGRHKIPILRKADVFLRKEGFGTFTQRVNFYEIRYDRSNGKLFRYDFTRNEESVINLFQSVDTIERYLQLLPELWRAIDTAEP